MDIDSAIDLMNEFPKKNKNSEKAFAIIKHNNVCGMAMANTCAEAYKKALQADPISSFGGVLISNCSIDKAAANLIDDLFFEILIAPHFSEDSLNILKKKKKRILLQLKESALPNLVYKTILNGTISQEKDNIDIRTEKNFKVATRKTPNNQELDALIFANKLVKHAKSNAIVLAKKGQFIAVGAGQTSRIDALQQAIYKAKKFNFNLSEVVMASDAFFPFSDCVETAYQVGIKAIIQPGGSIKDADSIAYCDTNDMVMVMTGTRHFKH